MSPSSLIFVAVVAIWATYLVVDVARRREYLATARSVDRFSSQMRVLQRRAVTDGARQSGRVTSSSLARSRPLVASGRVFAEEVAAPEAPSQDASSRAMSSDAVASGGSDSDATRPGAGDIAASAARPAKKAKAGRRDEKPGTRSRMTKAAKAPRRGRAAEGAAPGSTGVRRAAVVLLTLLGVAVVGGALTALGLVTWIVPVAAAALAVLVAVGMRRAAVARRRAARREAAAERRRREREAALARAAALEARPSAPSFPVAQEYVAPRADPLEIAGLTATPEAVEEAPAAEADPLLGEPAWDPTPVPPPTYTLKARAERPMPPPLEVPVPIEVETEDVAWDDERGQWRVVAG